MNKSPFYCLWLQRESVTQMGRNPRVVDENTIIVFYVIMPILRLFSDFERKWLNTVILVDLAVYNLHSMKWFNVLSYIDLEAINRCWSRLIIKPENFRNKTFLKINPGSQNLFYKQRELAVSLNCNTLIII